MLLRSVTISLLRKAIESKVMFKDDFVVVTLTFCLCFQICESFFVYIIWARGNNPDTH